MRNQLTNSEKSKTRNAENEISSQSTKDKLSARWCEIKGYLSLGKASLNLCCTITEVDEVNRSGKDVPMKII